MISELFYFLQRKHLGRLTKPVLGQHLFSILPKRSLDLVDRTDGWNVLFYLMQMPYCIFVYTSKGW